MLKPTKASVQSNLAIFRELLIFVALFFFSNGSTQVEHVVAPATLRLLLRMIWGHLHDAIALYTYFQWNNAAEIHWFNDVNVNVKVAGKIPNWRCWCEIHLYNDPAIINGGFSSQLCLITRACVLLGYPTNTSPQNQSLLWFGGMFRRCYPP